MNIEAQRELLRQRGFSSQHPLVRGEISIHPELVGHLHFGHPGQTSLQLHHDDFVRFLPEMQRSGMKNAFPQVHHESKALSRRKIISDKDTKHRSRSQDPRLGRHYPSNHLPHSDPHNISNHWVQRCVDEKKPWYMRESDHLLPSSAMQSRNDSGIGEEMWQRPTTSSPKQHLPHTNKSSFGMILKDKFQKNPNMYFPAPSLTTSSPPRVNKMNNIKDKDEDDWSDADTLVHNMSEGSFDKVSEDFIILIVNCFIIISTKDLIHAIIIVVNSGVTIMTQ